jgi:hypothetical protein
MLFGLQTNWVFYRSALHLEEAEKSELDDAGHSDRMDDAYLV